MPDPTNSFIQNISAYHNERWKALKKQVKKLLVDESEKNVHKARVEIKKIVALYAFVEFCDDRLDARKELKPLIKIFKLLGKIRDYHNTIALCQKFEISPDEFDTEKRPQKEASKSVRVEIEKYKEDFKTIAKNTASVLKATSSEKLKIYLEAEKEKIFAVLDAPTDRDSLHHSRRDIKILVYDVALLDTTIYLIEPAEIKAFDALQDNIGKWHDLMIFRQSLKDKKYKHRHPKKYDLLKKEEKLLARQINNPKDHAQTQKSSV